MPFFEGARNIIIQNSSFTDVSSGKTETFAEVLFKLKDAAALGISYDSIDHFSNLSVDLDERLTSIIASSSNGNDGLLHFVHGMRPSDVQAYGETAAKLCKEQRVLHANIFFGRLLSMFPGEGKKRLVPTLAYQLAASHYAPEELKVEILRALFLEPDIPQHNQANQFEKLIIQPLRNVKSLLPPVVFVLDSVHTIYCGGVKDVIEQLAKSLDLLHREGVDAKAVITGVGYHGIINTFQGNASIQTITRIYPIPVTPLSIARVLSFLFLDWMYSRSWPVQLIVGGFLFFCAFFSLFISSIVIIVIAARGGALLPTLFSVLSTFLGGISAVVFIATGTAWLQRRVVQFTLPHRFDS